METIIVFDLEWNMPNSWDEVDPQLKEELPTEIIEIGAVKLNPQFKQLDLFEAKIQPVYYKNLNKHVADLASRKSELITGDSFPNVMKKFWSWCGKSPVFGTWSDNDLIPLRNNLNYHGLESSLPGLYFDIQKLFGYCLEGSKRQRTVEFALDYMQIAKTLPFHYAINDAIYTSRILKKMAHQMQPDIIQYINFVTENLDEVMRDKFPMGRYANIKRAQQAIETKEWKCPTCRIKLKDTQIPIKKKNKYSIEGICSNHGVIKIIIKSHVTDTGVTLDVLVKRVDPWDQIVEQVKVLYQ